MKGNSLTLSEPVTQQQQQTVDELELEGQAFERKLKKDSNFG